MNSWNERTIDSRALGFARPEGPFEIRQYPNQTGMTPALVLTLQPGQLAAIEDLRGTGDLDIELLAAGISPDPSDYHQVQDNWRVHMPRSE